MPVHPGFIFGRWFPRKSGKNIMPSRQAVIGSQRDKKRSLARARNVGGKWSYRNSRTEEGGGGGYRTSRARDGSVVGD